MPRSAGTRRIRARRHFREGAAQTHPPGRASVGDQAVPGAATATSLDIEARLETSPNDRRGPEISSRSDPVGSTPPRKSRQPRFLRPRTAGKTRIGRRPGRSQQGKHLALLVTAPSHRSCHLLLKATRGVTIALVSSRDRKRRQPGLATDDPAFVGWHQLVRGIQGS